MDILNELEWVTHKPISSARMPCTDGANRNRKLTKAELDTVVQIPVAVCQHWDQYFCLWHEFSAIDESGDTVPRCTTMPVTSTVREVLQAISKLTVKTGAKAHCDKIFFEGVKWSGSVLHTQVGS